MKVLMVEQNFTRNDLLLSKSIQLNRKQRKNHDFLLKFVDIRDVKRLSINRL